MLPADPILARDCDFPVRTETGNRGTTVAYIRRGEALQECTCRMQRLREEENISDFCK